MVDSLLFKALEFLQKGRKVDDDTVSDNADCVGVKDTAGKQMELVLDAVHNNSVSRIRSASDSCTDIVFLSLLVMLILLSSWFLCIFCLLDAKDRTFRLERNKPRRWCQQVCVHREKSVRSVSRFVGKWIVQSMRDIQCIPQSMCDLNIDIFR